MKYYIGVCVRKSGHTAVTKPYQSEQECIDEMKSYVAKHYDDVAFTTYMTRESEKPITAEDVFGHPKSRDLMQNKKFLKELTYDGRKG